MRMMTSGKATTTDYSNGTYNTIEELAMTYFGKRGYGMFMSDFASLYYKFKDEGIFDLIDDMLDFYETKDYVFTHGFIPIDNSGDYKYNPSWRTVDRDVFYTARWINGIEMSIIKNIGEYIWEKIKKIGKFFKELFSKVIKFFKKLLFGIEEKKVAEKLEKIPEEKLTESINNLKKYLETKKLTIVPLNDTNELLVLFKQMCDNIPKVLETSFEINNTSVAGEKATPLLKLLIDKGVIQIPSNIHENTKKLLLGQTDKLGIEVQGEKLLTIVSDGKLSLDNITKTNIKEKYNDIITLFKTQITLMEDKYLPLINSLTENKNILSEIQKVAAKYTEDNGISKNDKKVFYQTQTAIAQFVSTFLFTIPRILQSSIIKLVSFYNEFIKVFVKEFSKEDNSIKEVLLKLKEPKIQQQLLKSTPVFKVIDGIKVYKYRDIAKKLNSIDPTLKMVMWQNPVGAWCTISALGTNYYAMIGDLDKLLSSNELDAIVYHELGHAKYSHIVSYIDKTMLQVLKGKIPDPTRNIQDEIQADSYAVEHTSLDTTISALKKIDAYYQKSIGSSVVEKQRFEYLALWKKNNSKPDIKEFLKNK